jgi:hypothetical protein
MSRRNRIGKELARERAALAKVEAEYRAKRNKRLAIYGPIAGVVLVGAVLTLVFTHAFGSTGTPSAKSTASVKASASASATTSASASASSSTSSSAKASASSSATSSASASKS